MGFWWWIYSYSFDSVFTFLHLIFKMIRMGAVYHEILNVVFCLLIYSLYCLRKIRTIWQFSITLDCKRYNHWDVVIYAVQNYSQSFLLIKHRKTQDFIYFFLIKNLNLKLMIIFSLLCSHFFINDIPVSSWSNASTNDRIL